MSAPYQVRVTEARRIARQEAAAAGITPDFISDLVETFYGHIRQNPDLGPIFAAEIGKNWAPHLATMKQFWSALIFHDGGYSGRPMPAHAKLTDLKQEHFPIWLGLWEHTLVELGASQEAKQAFMERAHRIATSFQLHLFSDPYEV